MLGGSYQLGYVVNNYGDRKSPNLADKSESVKKNNLKFHQPQI